MPFVKRNGQGVVVAACDAGAPPDWEEVQGDNADLLSYRYPNFSAYREQVKVAIDEAAERTRLKYVTPGSAQAMVYKEKAEEAKRYSADQSPNPANYPILMASVGIEAASLAQVAAGVLTTYALWTGLAAQIEAVRLGAKRQVDTAASVAEVQEIVAGIVWPV